jgi:adenosylcobinamide hydrolase
VIAVEHHDGALAWRPPEPVRVASTSALGGGVGVRHWFLNVHVDLDYSGDPVADLREVARRLGLRDEGVAMMTAKDVREVVLADDDGVDVAATVGLGWPTWAAAPDEPAAVPTPGTVNLLVVVPVALSDAALVNAVATATEAKVQALFDAGVEATGTASDAVCVACAVDGEPAPYGGPRSTWGARIARAVHRAVLDGARRS